jgi:glycosyltransferase involved in cell wall biosynthesis
MLTLITCVYGRMAKLQRVVRCVLNQDAKYRYNWLIYNNASTPLILGEFEVPDNINIILVNNHIDYETGIEYTNTGAIFRDALTHCPDNTTVVNFLDSDDLFLPEHVTEGIIGWALSIVKGGTEDVDTSIVAYKPYRSYYIDGKNDVYLEHNNMEPSIFVDFDYVKRVGFHYNAASYHQKWLSPLQANKTIWQPERKPTFIYDWGQNHNTHKISGLGDTSQNFQSHRKHEKVRNTVIVPCAPEIVEKYYNMVKNASV